MKNSIRVAIAGVGSNASILVQHIEDSKRNKELNQPSLSGVMCPEIGGFEVSDVEMVCAFEIDQNKVGLDLSEAIFVKPNAPKKYVDVPLTNVKVLAGPLLDGLDGYLNQVITAHVDCYNKSIDDVAEELIRSRSEILVCFLPTGASEACKFYARAAAKAKVAFINSTPELIARDEEIANLFKEIGIPLLGDDLRSHLGATTLHTALIELFKSRGIDINNTYQLNFGGNMDFYNLTAPGRSESKQISKKNALSAAGINAEDVSAGPNGFVKYLEDTKICYLRIEGKSILDSDISIELKLQVEDSPNAIGVIINAIRVAKIALLQGYAGVVNEVGAFMFKSPTIGATESEALQSFRKFIDSYVPQHQ